MKFSMKMAVLSLAGVLALGGAATAASFIFNNAETQSGTVTTDSALVLKWGESTNTSAITDLDTSSSQFRQLNIDWSASDKVTGSINLNLTLTDTSKAIVVEIASKEWGVDTTADVATLSTSGVSDGDSISTDITVVEDLSYSLQNSKTYYVKVSLSQGKADTTINGELKAVLSHKEAA